MIKPTVGRVVLFTPAKGDSAIAVNPGQPLAAIVAYVWSDTMVNLAVFSADGLPASRTSVPLIQDGMLSPTHGFFCEWMPYQKGQAAKTEALEKELNKS
jgi:hypothetical protein